MIKYMKYIFSKHTLFICLGGVLVVFLVATLGMRAHVHWVSVQYFGEIVTVGEETFSIKTHDNERVSVITEYDTSIRQGRSLLGRKLALGDRVIVVGISQENGLVRARVVRVINVPLP